MKRLSHISDLHFGRTDPAVVEGLLSELNGDAPDLVIISGDFTMRARLSEWEEARAFLSRINPPWIAVPGNHDITAYTKSHGLEPVRPLAQPDRHDLPGLIDEAVPRFAAMVDEVVVGAEDPVRQPIVAQELPDVFDRVQLRAFWGQRHDRDGGRHDEMARQVPSGLVQEENCMLAGRNLGRDLGQVQGHRLGVATGQDERCTFAVVRAYSSEDVG